MLKKVLETVSKLGARVPDPAPIGLSTHIVPASWNTFVARALDLGCKDVKLLLNPPAPAAAPAVPAASTYPKVLRSRPKAAAKA